MVLIWRKEEFEINDDKKKIDRDKVYEMLSRTYWADNRTMESISNSIKNSICFGVYYKEKQIGFARAITDKVFFSWIADVVIVESFRGSGLGKWLVQCILEHQDIKNTKQRLATKDAHGLYAQYGFKVDECMSRVIK